ncbi:hypothetical protein NPIL_551871 [Nephila pilipes]|uniref:Uncharacterized protein n=1 Tax=Nephila pilipes TaxID=299642 RepID=A0A8X6NTK8_NEPPI|nr:hypothetical protein NPIL_551871 [Nephila pilipes]
MAGYGKLRWRQPFFTAGVLKWYGEVCSLPEGSNFAVAICAAVRNGYAQQRMFYRHFEGYMKKILNHCAVLLLLFYRFRCCAIRRGFAARRRLGCAAEKCVWYWYKWQWLKANAQQKYSWRLGGVGGLAARSEAAVCQYAVLTGAEWRPVKWLKVSQLRCTARQYAVPRVYCELSLFTRNREEFHHNIRKKEKENFTSPYIKCQMENIPADRLLERITSGRVRSLLSPPLFYAWPTPKASFRELSPRGMRIERGAPEKECL